MTYGVDGKMRRGSPSCREIPQPEGVVGETYLHFPFHYPEGQGSL